MFSGVNFSPLKWTLSISRGINSTVGVAIYREGCKIQSTSLKAVSFKLINGVNLGETTTRTYMALWRLYYHLVWVTKERQPLINSDREDDLYRYLIAKADDIRCIVHAIGGVEDHIHLIVSIPPTLAIADFVKRIKGSSAHFLNQALSASLNKFGWQEGYGVFSLGGKQLDQAVDYVKNQKAHHSNGTAIASLEQATNQDDSPGRWHPS